MDRYTLITGGAGFIGTNLAHALLTDGTPVVIADDLSREGTSRNAEWLRERHGEAVRIERVDVADAARITPLVHGADAVFHFAAQVAVTASVIDPRHDFEVNLLGTFNVLDAARTARRPPPVLFTSTNKVYGALSHLELGRDERGWTLRDAPGGVAEGAPLDFHSPYGCSKGAADQYVRDYARIYGVPTVVFRMSCIYGEHQYGTEDQGWVAHFARSALTGRPVTIYGDGHQVRDLLWVGDLVRALRAARARAERIAGSIFNVGGGPANAATVREVVDRLMELAGRRIPVTLEGWRPGDQRCYVTDTRRMSETLEWEPSVGVDEGLARLVHWLRRADEARPSTPAPIPARAAVRALHRRVAAAGGAP